MKWIEVTEANGRTVWINVDNVAFVRDFKTHRSLYFVSDAFVKTKELLDELVNRMR